MAKTISPELKTHLSGFVTTICTCWQITRRDGTAFHFTDHDEDLVVSGQTYLASLGYSRTAIANQTDMSVDNLEINGIFDDSILKQDELRGGLFDFAEIKVFLVNWADLTQGILRLRRGYIGEVSSVTSGMFTAELRGMVQRLATKIGGLYSPECRADLGDRKCRIPIAPGDVQRSRDYAVGDFVTVADGVHTDIRRYGDRLFECTTLGTTDSSTVAYDYTVGHTTTDGSAVFTARQAWTRGGQVVAVVGYGQTFSVTMDELAGNEIDGWFIYGVLTWESGLNVGKSIELKGWTAGTNQMILFLPADNPISPGDRFRIYAGCDKHIATCRDKFDNVVNFRGEPYVPGLDMLIQYGTNAAVAFPTSTQAKSDAVAPTTPGGEAGTPDVAGDVEPEPDSAGPGLG